MSAKNSSMFGKRVKTWPVFIKHRPLFLSLFYILFTHKTGLTNVPHWVRNGTKMFILKGQTRSNSCISDPNNLDLFKNACKGNKYVAFIIILPVSNNRIDSSIIIKHFFNMIVAWLIFPDISTWFGVRKISFLETCVPCCMKEEQIIWALRF